MDYDFRFDYDGFDKAMATIALIVCLPCTWYMTLNGVIEWLLGLVIVGTTITITVALVVPCIATTVEVWCSQWSRVCDTLGRMDWTEADGESEDENPIRAGRGHSVHRLR